MLLRQLSNMKTFCFFKGLGYNKNLNWGGGATPSGAPHIAKQGAQDPVILEILNTVIGFSVSQGMDPWETWECHRIFYQGLLIF